MTNELNPLQRQLVNRYQGGFPLLARPFALMARTLKCSERDIIQNIDSLLQQGILSRFGPLYDAVQMGGALTLAALSVPESQYEQVTQQVNSLSQVAHNYRRDHSLNMWFVLATETEVELESAILQIEEMSGLQVYNFPKQSEFFIGLWLELTPQCGVNTITPPTVHKPLVDAYCVDAMDRQIILHSQAGLALVADPWQPICEAVGCSEDELLERLQRLLDSGVIRRIGLVPNHYRLGLKANGMTVWDVNDEQAELLGQHIGQLDFVSHCYLRPRHLPEWRYNLFAMVHGHDRVEVLDKTRIIKGILGDACVADNVLFSSAILKKTGLRFAA